MNTFRAKGHPSNNVFPLQISNFKFQIYTDLSRQCVISGDLETRYFGHDTPNTLWSLRQGCFSPAPTFPHLPICCLRIRISSCLHHLKLKTCIRKSDCFEWFQHTFCKLRHFTKNANQPQRADLDILGLTGGRCFFADQGLIHLDSVYEKNGETSGTCSP